MALVCFRFSAAMFAFMDDGIFIRFFICFSTEPADPRRVRSDMFLAVRTLDANCTLFKRVNEDEIKNSHQYEISNPVEPKRRERKSENDEGKNYDREILKRSKTEPTSR